MSELRTMKVGIIGYGFMGKIHANAYLKIPYAAEEVAVRPLLAGMSGRNAERVNETAALFGIARTYTDYREMIEEVDAVDNCGPDPLREGPVLAALEAGKPLLCEKPLGRTSDEARRLWEAAQKAGTVHMTCFNYRFVPAVRLAYGLIASGRLGDLYHFRGRYYQSPGFRPETTADKVWYCRDDRVGILGGIGSHIIDLSRFLMGEIKSVSSLVRTFCKVRRFPDGKEYDVKEDELSVSAVEFASGAVGSLEASGISAGHRNRNEFEVYGTKGSLRFDLEDLNHLYVFLPDEQPGDLQGFTQVSVTEKGHPLGCPVLPRGHIQGWENAHVHALSHFLKCAAGMGEVGPLGADFYDGYQAMRIIRAMELSSSEGTRRTIDSVE